MRSLPDAHDTSFLLSVIQFLHVFSCETYRSERAWLERIIRDEISRPRFVSSMTDQAWSRITRSGAVTWVEVGRDVDYEYTISIRPDNREDVSSWCETRKREKEETKKNIPTFKTNLKKIKCKSNFIEMA